VLREFLDVFEFLFAYRLRFGLCGVDMAAAARTRSARWYPGFLRGGELRPPPAALPARPYVRRRVRSQHQRWKLRTEMSLEPRELHV